MLSKGLGKAEARLALGRREEVPFEGATIQLRARAVEVFLDELVLHDPHGLEHVGLRDELLFEFGAGALRKAAQDVPPQGRLQLRSQARVRFSVGHGTSRVRAGFGETAALHAREDAVAQA